MLKRYLTAALMVAATAVAVTACSTASSSPPVQKTALWKVTSAHRVMYITGDMNVSLKKYPVPAALSETFAESSELVLEGNPNPDKSKVMAMVMQLGLQPSGETLSDDLTASQSKIVQNAFSSLDIPFARMQRFRPWFAAIAVGGKAALKLGIKPHQLYLHFYHEAENAKMPVTFLDTSSEELEMLAGMPKKLQVNMLMMTSKEALKPKNPEKRARMVEAWRSGDTKTVAKIADEGFQDYPQLYKIMVASRHPRWLKTLESKLAVNGKPVFVIVGGPHLFGPDDLISGLKKAGYQVTQL